MLQDASSFSGFAVDDIGSAVGFYRDTLGLEVTEQEGGLTLHLKGAGDVFVYPKPDHTPATFTILNFSVDDVDAKVEEMSERGIEFERYEGISQDELGIARGDFGPTIAWFTDPAGNILSVLEDS